MHIAWHLSGQSFNWLSATVISNFKSMSTEMSYNLWFAVMAFLKRLNDVQHSEYVLAITLSYQTNFKLNIWKTHWVFSIFV